MGLLVMILGLALFLGVHTLTTQRELRARLSPQRARAATRSAMRWCRPPASR